MMNSSMEASTITMPILSYSSLNSWTTIIRSVSAFDAACMLAALGTFLKVLRAVCQRRKMTQLQGPPRTSVIYGVSNDLALSTDPSAMYEHWAEEYGVVYKIPSVLGQTVIVLCDPKAIAHFYARETWTYVLTPLSSMFVERLVS
jgi:hypothetical protein